MFPIRSAGRSVSREDGILRSDPEGIRNWRPTAGFRSPDACGSHHAPAACAPSYPGLFRTAARQWRRSVPQSSHICPQRKSPSCTPPRHRIARGIAARGCRKLHCRRATSASRRPSTVREAGTRPLEADRRHSPAAIDLEVPLRNGGGAIGRRPAVLGQHLRGRPSERGSTGSRPARPSADGTQRGMQDEAWASGKQLTQKRFWCPPNRDNHTPRPGLARSPRPGQGRRPPMRGRHDTRRLRCHPESCSRPSCMSATGHCSLSGCRPVDSSPPLRSTTRRWWRTGTLPCAPRISSGAWAILIGPTRWSKFQVSARSACAPRVAWPAKPVGQAQPAKQPGLARTPRGLAAGSRARHAGGSCCSAGASSR